jgi:hypothetical protein
MADLHVLSSLNQTTHILLELSCYWLLVDMFKFVFERILRLCGNSKALTVCGEKKHPNGKSYPILKDTIRQIADQFPGKMYHEWRHFPVHMFMSK